MTGGDVPLEPGLVSRAGWSLFDDSAAVVLQTEDGWVGARPPTAGLDWYFFGYGHAYTDALAEYTLFGGVIPLIPRYVLGVWWSRFWPYTAADLEQLVADFADHHVPLDVLVVDMDWHLPGHWTGYTWNHDLIPNPEAFLADMHARGLRVTLNLHPADGVKPHEAAYPAFAKALGRTELDDAPIPFRITDRQFTELYFTLLHHPLEEQGVDFWWIDWQQGESSEIKGLDPLLWLNHLHYADVRRRGQRPLLFSRWGGLGNHRYPIGFSGDTFGGWPTLASLPHFTATAANVGFGWWSHDIGGHFGAVDADILTRWVQFGALSPCLRLHAAKHPLAERRPWAFSARALAAMRSAFELRYALVPYLYTMTRHAHERGVALCRPMYYAYPEHESAYLARGQYQLGDDLLAAPVTAPSDPQTGRATKDVWIPPGAWYRFDTGAAFVGPRWIRLDVDLETMPLFARAGAVFPMAKPANHLVDIPHDWLEIRVFPGDNGSFRLYEDDGVSEAYLSGEYEWTTFTYGADDPHCYELRIDPVAGHCPTLPTTRTYSVTFVDVDAPDSVVDAHGKSLVWLFDPGTRTLRVDIPAHTKHEAIALIVRRPVEARVARHTDATGASIRPFTHVVAYTASDEAQRQLARALLIPPYDGDQQELPCAAETVWRDVRYEGVTEIGQAIPLLATEATLTAPFALESSLQPRRWEVETRFIMGDEEVTSLVRGPCINPPIQRWRVRYTGLATDDIVQADTASRLTITEPYEAHLDYQIASTAEASATIELAEPMTIRFDTWTNGFLSLNVDGHDIATDEQQPTLAGLARPWPVARSGPVVLIAGKHTITVRLAAPEGGAWVFGVLMVDDSGEPVVRCAQVIDDHQDLR